MVILITRGSCWMSVRCCFGGERDWLVQAVGLWQLGTL